ncbi:hypothetical protein F2Q70_00029345 [Brassica cretica]|uniref:Uncharacterized protein n=1 Tax=Brassica cretica TaxID=69181 RepID=A0A8S9FKL9_BRACR|nr:hypothetical protein F2Q70_00029345 [Brassica cretica]
MGGNGVPSFLRRDFSGAALVQGRNSPREMGAEDGDDELKKSIEDFDVVYL